LGARYTGVCSDKIARYKSPKGLNNDSDGCVSPLKKERNNSQYLILSCVQKTPKGRYNNVDGFKLQDIRSCSIEKKEIDINGHFLCVGQKV